jgi:hypothetical protein
MIRQPAWLGQPGLPALLVAPIRLPDFPVSRSQRSDHSVLPAESWSRGTFVPSGASSMSIVEHQSQLMPQKISPTQAEIP